MLSLGKHLNMREVTMPHVGDYIILYYMHSIQFTHANDSNMLN